MYRDATASKIGVFILVFFILKLKLVTYIFQIDKLKMSDPFYAFYDFPVAFRDFIKKT